MFPRLAQVLAEETETEVRVQERASMSLCRQGGVPQQRNKRLDLSDVARVVWSCVFAEPDSIPVVDHSFSLTP